MADQADTIDSEVVPEAANKACCRCGAVHPATTEHFPPRKSGSRDGLEGRCRACDRISNRAKKKRERENPNIAAYYAEYMKQWRARNPDYHNKYYHEKLAPSGKALEYRKKWIKSLSPEKKKAFNRRIYESRWKYIDGPKTNFTREMGLDLLEKQKNKCWWCSCHIGSGTEFHMDHRIPLSRGGQHNISNVVISCPTCNLRKGSKMPWEWRDRLF